MARALYDARQTPEFVYDEQSRRLTTLWKVRAPRTLALQSPNLPARGDPIVFMGESLVVKGRRIRGLDRFGSANEADDLTEVEVLYGPDVDTFGGGSSLDPDDPSVKLLRGGFEPYDVEIPYHIHEAMVVDGGGVISIYTPAPAVYEATVERVQLKMNLEVFGAPERAAIASQRGKLHKLDGVNPWAVFDGAEYNQIGGDLTEVVYSWRLGAPITLDPFSGAELYKPGDGADDDYPLPPFARWAAIPGPEVGEGEHRRREAPTYKVFGRLEEGDIAVLPGNPGHYLLNGTAGGGVGGG